MNDYGFAVAFAAFYPEFGGYSVFGHYCGCLRLKSLNRSAMSFCPMLTVSVLPSFLWNIATVSMLGVRRVLMKDQPVTWIFRMI